MHHDIWDFSPTGKILFIKVVNCSFTEESKIYFVMYRGLFYIYYMCCNHTVLYFVFPAFQKLKLHTYNLFSKRERTKLNLSAGNHYTLMCKWSSRNMSVSIVNSIVCAYKYALLTIIALHNLLYNISVWRDG